MSKEIKQASKKWPTPVCRWAQRESLIIMTIPLQNFKYHRLQITNKKLWFLGVTKNGDIHEYDNDFLFDIDTEKSGQKLGAQNEQKIYLKKICLKPAHEVKPPTGPNGQEYPSHYVKASYKGDWWDRIFKAKDVKIAVDWSMWQDKDQLEDQANDFSIENMVDLMKRNGDWDDEDENLNPEEQAEQEEIAKQQFGAGDDDNDDKDET